jgi:2-keto-4-pentenoate hydratase/2-oxohepta-3-ene-1,7-dioic acid hydratase in catechol pathway
VSKKVDWEAECAVVIGRPDRNIKVQDAMQHVAGYTIMNDLSARDLSRTVRPRRGTCWSCGYFSTRLLPTLPSDDTAHESARHSVRA